MDEPKMMLQLIPRSFKGTDDPFASIGWEPSVEHEPIDCPSCGWPVWIGPRQLKMLTSGQAVGLCVYCLVEAARTDSGLAEAILSQRMISLNPDIDNAPKRPRT
jgi:hypothetical protein